MGLLAAEIDTVKGDSSLLGGNDSHDASEGRSFTRPVASEKGNQLSLSDLGRYPFKNVTVAIVSVDILKTEHLSRLPGRPLVLFGWL